MTVTNPTTFLLSNGHHSAASSVQVYQCQRQWDDLQVSGHEDVRFCDSCRRTVHKVVDVEGFQRAVAQARCVMAHGRNTVDGAPIFVVGMAAAKPYGLDSAKLTWDE